MLSPEQQKELLCLAVNGRISPIRQFMEELNVNDDNYDSDETPYEQYIKNNKPLCMFCGSNVTTLDYSLIRHIDCASTDWTIGCCCCGYIDYEEYHNPRHAQFYCNKDCYNNASKVRHKVFNLRCSNTPTDEYFALNSTDYTLSSHLIKKYHTDTKIVII
jgi:hypothetical protein